MNIIDGRAIAKQILDDLKIKISSLPFQPVFCDVLVGEDPASSQYVRMKAKTAEKIGFKFHNAQFPESISTEDLIAELIKLNNRPKMCGLIVQLPLPAHVDRKKILDSIEPAIDVDCTGKVNSEKFYSGNPFVLFPTAAAVMRLLDSVIGEYAGKTYAVVGQGDLVGKPVKFLLEQKDCRVEVVRSKTENPEAIFKSADVIVSAVGKPGLITGSKVKNGAIVIDAGTAESNGGIVGDVDSRTLENLEGYLSPVPGGVGPVTVAMLMQNVYVAAKKLQS